MNNLTVFNNKEFGEVKVVLINDEPHFVGKDIAEVLGYADINKAVIQHVDKEDRKACSYKAYANLVPSLWNKKNDFSNKILINESGLYSLIMSSKLPKAKEFKRWVTAEVLPTIRKHGAYMTPEVIEKTLTDPDFLIRLATELKEEKVKRTLAEQKVIEAEQTIKTLQPKADYYDLIINNPSLVTTTQIAKDYGMAAKSFNALLHKLKVQYKKSEQWLLYCKYQDKGYVSSETLSIKRKDNTTYNKMLTKWTQSGRLFLYNLLKDNNILPVIERQ